MTRILPRQIGARSPVAVGGKGIELFDSNGRAYLDASGGAAVSCLGHGHPDVNAPLHAQIDQLAYTHSSFFTTEVAERLADKLVEDAPEGLARLFRQRRLGGCRSVAEDGAAVFCRDRLEAHESDRAPPELSRQHAGGARDRRQRAAPTQFAAADRDRTCRSVLRLSLQGRGESDEAYAARAAHRSKTRSWSSAPTR